MKSKTIGGGGFGKVRIRYSEKFKRMVVEKEVGDNFIKTTNSTRLHITSLINNYARNEDMLKKETIVMSLMKVCKLDCCVEILDFAPNPFRIVMEYCEGGDLRKILNEYNVPVEDKVEMIGQILDAINKIHKFGIIHGDLKCQNIFLANKYIPGNTDDIVIKIGDFGLSEIGGDLVLGGTKGFAAPEAFMTGGSFESDIYSIGKVMLEIMTGYPVKVIAQINKSNLSRIKNKLPKFLNVSEFYDLVTPCLNEDPKKRPNSKELLTLYAALVLLSN